MARLFTDENFPLPAVHELRRLGHDVLTVFDAGLANQRFADAGVFDYAQVQGRAVVTLNLNHFKRLHRQRGPHHAGLILCRKDNDFIGMERRIHAEITQRPNLSGQLVRIKRPPSWSARLPQPSR
jgi:predicted nuclease of predicted toxin-antitoxin system